MRDYLEGGLINECNACTNRSDGNLFAGISYRGTIER